MKKAKKSRVSWPSDSMLCQVKMFITEDCPAKVGSQSSTKPRASNLPLPPGFEITQVATRRHIPRIKWKRPPKFILDDTLLVGSGGESTETLTENLRIAKVLEAFYPQHSLIPTRPSVSPAVEQECYDDTKTPNIPIEDEPVATIDVESSHNSKLGISLAKEAAPPATVSALGSDLILAALGDLLKTNEQGSLVDAGLLVKLLSDPTFIKNLMDNTTCKPLETATNVLNTNITKPRLVTSPALPSPRPVSFPQPGNYLPHIAPTVSIQTSVSVATDPLHKPTQSVASALSMKHPLVFHPCTGPKPMPRLEDSYSTAPLKPIPGYDDAVLVSEQKTVTKPLNVLESARIETDAQIRNGDYPMNINRDDQVSANPVKNLEYFKNLIREHGRVAPPANESNIYKGRVDNNSMNKVAKVKVKKPCMFFGRSRGCKLGESCLYLHDLSKRMWTDAAAEFPRAKRLKFST